MRRPGPAYTSDRCARGAEAAFSFLRPLFHSDPRARAVGYRFTNRHLSRGSPTAGFLMAAPTTASSEKRPLVSGDFFRHKRLPNGLGQMYCVHPKTCRW